MGENGQFSIVPAGPGIHHTIASGDEKVTAAGQITFNSQGAVTMFDNFTGHYTPCTECAATFIQRGVDAFGLAGIRIPRRVITDYGGKAP
ncbi:hypothetical protein ETD86_48770 [Nonomuraea turkmeniaca]|uniref:Uncharacterized protein n=1 Tax=Nonomuraea turkmeniaca TaxID=103838 RepID=A0A5S4EXC0_9ACTN|nr:hypothetical protein [Nonomuraea turkmeniaca]TMR08210.1 hypothetical protein ETD86_48770 [Nonomuraea turkmeniaca]